MDSGVQPLARRIFEGLSPSYDRVLMAATLLQDARWKGWLLKRARLRQGQLVLDLGCGTGVLETMMRSDVLVVGLDLTEEMLRLAKDKQLLPAGSLSVGDAENLPFKDACFDSVVSCYVAKYCNASRLLDEVARVLRSGGRFVMYDFSRPRGPFAPFHALYVYGGLKLFGMAARQFDPASALTYEALPEVIRSRLWDEGFEETLASVGFGDIGMERLTGGVVTGFWATKK